MLDERRATIANTLVVRFLGTAFATFAALCLVACRDAGTSQHADAGRQVFESKCLQCHAIAPEAPSRTGPNLCGVVGRAAGSAEGFGSYSEVLRKAQFVWTDERLDAFLKEPQAVLPGNVMGFFGLPEPDERHALIAFLKEQTR